MEWEPRKEDNAFAGAHIVPSARSELFTETTIAQIPAQHKDSKPSWKRSTIASPITVNAVWKGSDASFGPPHSHKLFDSFLWTAEPVCVTIHVTLCNFWRTLFIVIHFTLPYHGQARGLRYQQWWGQDIYQYGQEFPSSLIWTWDYNQCVL